MGQQGSVWGTSQCSSPEWKRFLAGSVTVRHLAPGLPVHGLIHESLPFCLVQCYQAFDFH